MTARRVSMRKIKDILKLASETQFSQRQIARAVQIGLGTVSVYLKRYAASGLQWGEASSMDEGALARALFPPSESPDGNYVLPDFGVIQTELKRKGVTRQLLWEEYRDRFPQQSLGYSQFCQRYRDWHLAQKLSMRQVHKAGEKLFVDYAGPTVSIMDPKTGQVRQAQIFVAVLGASNYTYAEATWSQELNNWLESHRRTFEFLGGVPEIVVPDQLKSGVSRACRYDPDVNLGYHHLARYYGTVIIPARPRKPRDKPKAENAVQIVERWILARLRHRQFFSLDELNQVIATLLDDLNGRAFKALPGSRRSQFEQLDKPALKPLPRRPYEPTEVKLARVNIDYHIQFKKHFYSVPCALVRREVEVQATARSVSIFHAGHQVASHVRAYKKGFTTNPQHMPEAHRKHLEWTPQRLTTWGRRIGPWVGELVKQELARREHPEQAYRSTLGLLHLERSYGAERLDAACQRALALGTTQYKRITGILKSGLDQVPAESTSQPPTVDHGNVRGQTYYR